MSTLITGCGSTPRPGVRPALTQPVNNDQQLEDAVGALQVGDTKRARKLLKAMAKRNPTDQRVVILREGMEEDPVKIFGTVAFDYRVRPGDRLTVLAQRFLGDRLKFHLLGRYNRVTTDALTPGQILRIPGFAPVPKPRVEPKPTAKADQRPSTTATPPRTAPAAPATNPAAAGRLRAQGLAALNRGAVANAVVLLRRARTLDPASAPIRADLARAERLLKTVKARQ